jgi:hypothetical protein
LQAPIPQLAKSNDYKDLKVYVGDQSARRKELPKNLRTERDFSSTIQMWYDRIHMYLQLIRLREGKASNTGNIVRFAKQKHIKWPEKLTMEELKDGLQFGQIWKAELRKESKRLRKVHLQNCLLDAQSKANTNGQRQSSKRSIVRKANRCGT